MATVLRRTIYTQSGVRVTPNDKATLGDGGWDTTTTGPIDAAEPRTVQNATMTLNIPRADVNVFGVLGVVARPQLEAETATIEFAFIPEKFGSAMLAAAKGSFSNASIDALITDTTKQTPSYVNVHVDGVGRIKDALMNSFSGEATIGGLPTMTMSFTGATNDSADLAGDGPPAVAPDHGTAGNAAVNSAFGADCFGAALCPNNPTNIDVDLVNPKDIILAGLTAAANFGGGAETIPVAAGGVDHKQLINEPTVDSVDPVDYDVDSDDDDVINGCAQSASFAWDVPVETILCLGSRPEVDGIALGNPPGTASFTVEALSLQIPGNLSAFNYLLKMGVYNFVLTGGEIDSRTHNLAVGDLFGTYNYVIGGTGDGFRMA